MFTRQLLKSQMVNCSFQHEKYSLPVRYVLPTNFDQHCPHENAVPHQLIFIEIKATVVNNLLLF